MSLLSLLINNASLLNKSINSFFFLNPLLIGARATHQPIKYSRTTASNLISAQNRVSWWFYTHLLFMQHIFMWFTSDLHEFNSIWKCLMHVRFQQGVCYMIHTGFSCMAHSDAFVCARVYVCVWDQCGRRSLETAYRNTRHTHSSLFQVPGIFCNHLYCSFNCSSRCLRKATGMFNTNINKGNY